MCRLSKYQSVVLRKRCAPTWASARDPGTGGSTVSILRADVSLVRVRLLRAAADDVLSVAVAADRSTVDRWPGSPYGPDGRSAAGDAGTSDAVDHLEGPPGISRGRDQRTGQERR